LKNSHGLFLVVNSVEKKTKKVENYKKLEKQLLFRNKARLVTVYEKLSWAFL
jgi:hypothetical protein